MDRKKILKKILINKTIENKMAANNIMNFKNFAGQKDFNVKIEPFTKTTKKEIEYMIGNSQCNKNYYFEWTNHKCFVKPFYDVDMFYTDKDEYEKNIDIIQDEVKEVLKKLYPETDIAISSSHGEKIKIKSKNKVKTQTKGYAISYHFVMCDYHTTIPQLKEFNEKK